MEPIGIVGWKNSGKTTLITRLLPALRRRGARVSTIKHVHHSIDLDEPGKDTFRHRQAGAVDVVLYSDARWAILHERREQELADEPDLTRLMRHMTDVDLVLVEGFKNQPIRKIEIRGGEDATPMADRGITDIIAIVTDGPPDARLPTFGRDDVEPLSNFLLQSVVFGSAALAEA